MSHLATLISSNHTVFTTQEIGNLLDIPTKRGVERLLRRAKKSSQLLNPQKGVWTLPKYNQKELAGKLFQGGYISLEKVLFEAGANFQSYINTVTTIWYKKVDLLFNDENYIAHRIKPEIYNNPLCIQELDGYREAMPERALCDLVYLHPDTHLDNPEYFQSLQSEIRFKKLLPLYPKTTQSYVKKLIT